MRRRGSSAPGSRRSAWGAVNIRRAGELIGLGRMRPAGLRAFEARAEGRSGVSSFEQPNAVALDAAHEQRFRANGKAWDFFQRQAPWYRRTATWRVVSAKREETRLRRLGRLIAASEHGRTIPPPTRPTPRA